MSNHPSTGDHSTPEASKLIEQMVERPNMLAAYQRVKRNKGAAGMNGMSVDQIILAYYRT